MLRQISSINFIDLMKEVNTKGFASVQLDMQSPNFKILGEELFIAMDNVNLNPSGKYYNELSLYWPEDWSDIHNGISNFHDPSTVGRIQPIKSCSHIIKTTLGNRFYKPIYDFSNHIRLSVPSTHIGLDNNELRLSRVMMRQMNSKFITQHAGADFHEDCGYQDKPYQQLISVVLTTYGIPTISKFRSLNVGELAIFNAFDRRRQLGLSDNKAFIHRGPKNGPKMFFFFEFLGPRKNSKFESSKYPTL